MTETKTGTPSESSAEAPARRVNPRSVIWLPGLVVALGAAVATAHGLFEVAVAARVPVGIAWLYPLITDGLALVAYAATARLHGGAARYAWAVVVLAAGLSGLAQAVFLAGDASVDASPALRFGVGAWPAVAAAVVAHLLYLLTATDPRPSTRGAAPDADSPPSARPPTPAVARPEEAPVAVRPAVQPRPYSPAPVQPVLYDAVTAELATAGTTSEGGGDGFAVNTRDEHPADRAEQLAAAVTDPAAGAPSAPPRHRARVAAERHANRHGVLPTVSELEALAAVSRGTAAAALKALRERPSPLHLVPADPAADPETPNRETQP